MNVSDRILKFGSAFSGRLDETSLSFAMDYIHRGENAVALDTLFEYLYENDVNISSTEFNEAISLAKEFDVSENDVAYLKELIESN